MPIDPKTIKSWQRVVDRWGAACEILADRGDDSFVRSGAAMSRHEALERTGGKALEDLLDERRVLIYLLREVEAARKRRSALCPACGAATTKAAGGKHKPKCRLAAFLKGGSA